MVFDVLNQLPTKTFSTADVQDALATKHGLAMPQQTVATLLHRAVNKKHLQRDAGRYRIIALPPSTLKLSAEKDRIGAGQARLGDALRAHAMRRGLSIESTGAALDLLLEFLEQEQIGILLGSSVEIANGADASSRKSAIIAEFIQDAIKDDPALRSVLGGILEGLVLYHAAFLPNLDAPTRHFKNLRVVFDSVLVRQAIGYEGDAMKTLLRETTDLLKAGGIQCLIFDKTVLEIRRILSMYEERFATEEGRRSLRPVPMARHFLTQRYSPSDIREMAALLENDISKAGFQIQPTPPRIRDYTASESTLAARLADPLKHDELEPRVVHDVDCVAAILTLRGGHRSASIEDSRAVFVTSSPLVIRNTRLWYIEDEHETGVEPIVHIRALANLAWLKRPKLCADFKERELVALCAAALRPAQETWRRFLRHLETLESSQKLSSDEVSAIVISAMSDRLLREAEIENEDPNDIDAVTLDDIVDRVKSSYSIQSEQNIKTLKDEYESKFLQLETLAQTAIEKAKAAEQTLAASIRRREVKINERAVLWARRLTQCAYWIIVAIVAGGALALIVGHPFHTGLIGTIIGFAIVVFILLELFGILRHISELRSWMEARLRSYFCKWLIVD